ncbi:hypothetical protein [Actinoplanes sp. URMC 104]|uniref:hypothetical protein n=1 Tax=Actinoplanes sp. URMC 104 TaxID=3423409 RepID=UPI003F1982E9
MHDDKEYDVSTVSTSSGQHQKEPDHRPTVIKKMLAIAGSGILIILSAVATGALAGGLAYAALMLLGILVLGVVLAVVIYTVRR